MSVQPLSERLLLTRVLFMFWSIDVVLRCASVIRQAWETRRLIRHAGPCA